MLVPQKLHHLYTLHIWVLSRRYPETFTEEDTRYKKHCTQDNDTSIPFKASTLGPHTVLHRPSASPSHFPEFHRWAEISSFSKVILVWGKARSLRAPNLGCRGAESPGWFDVSPKNSIGDMMYGRVCIVVMKLPITSCP